MRILLAEDEHEMSLVLKLILSRRGYQVETAKNGEEALQKAIASPPDIVVSDVMMPEMDGFMLCRKIKADARLRSIPVILYTATDTERGEAELAAGIGAARLLSKMDGPAPLLEVVIEEFKKAASGEQAAAPPGDEDRINAEYLRVLSGKLFSKERELKAERDQARQYLDISGVMFAALDRTGAITMINRKGCSVLGYEAEKDLIGKNWFDTCLPPELRQEVVGVFRGLMAGETKVLEYYENPLLRKDGEQRIVAFHNTIVKDGEAIVGVLFSGEDVTERKRAESEVKVKELFLDHATDSIFVHDLDGNFIYVNETACRALGYAREELLRLNISRLDGPESAALIPERMKALKENGSAFFETVHRRKDGSDMPVEVHVRIIEMRGRSAALSVARDISERRRTTGALLRAQKMDAIGQLAGGVAHDLNNLLGPIIAYADFLRKGMSAGDRRLEDLDGITKAAESASALVRQLLAFGRRQVLSPRNLSVNKAVSGLDGMLRRILGERVKVGYELDAPASALVRVDPGQLEQVIINLAVNARDAMPRGGALTISTRVEATPGGGHGGWLVLSVKDTGTGMDESVLHRIFEPFFTTKEGGYGVGLGLSTAYGIIKQSGGDIGAESSPGAGSVFHVSLPLSDGKEPAETSPAVPAVTSAGKCALLAEDDESMRKVVRRMLAAAGYDVTEAADGSEALKLLEAAPARFSLLVTDVVMPEMDGIELSQRILADYPHIKVLCMSGYADKGEELSAALGSRVAYLSKPFAPDALAEKLEELMKTG